MNATVRYRPARHAWVVYVYRGGKRTSRACGADGEQMAGALARELEQEGGAPGRWLRGGGALPMDEVLRDWHATYKPTLSRSYEETTRGLIENHLIPYFGVTDLRALAETRLVDFVAARMDSGLSAAVCRNALSLLRRVLTLHVEAGASSIATQQRAHMRS
jgi:hypothetical protein